LDDLHDVRLWKEASKVSQGWCECVVGYFGFNHELRVSLVPREVLEQVKLAKQSTSDGVFKRRPFIRCSRCHRTGIVEVVLGLFE
jgi:hypothetical protein